MVSVLYPSSVPRSAFRLPRWCAAAAVVLALAPLGWAGTTELRKETGLLRIPVEGRDDRSTWLYVPKSYDPGRRYPLVVALHPAGLRGESLAGEWGDAAGRSGAFIVLAPECKDTKRRIWAMNDEAEFLDTTKRIMLAYNVDPARVLLTGFSQGANFTYIFGLRNPTLFRALAAVSGVLQARPGPESDRIFQAARGVPVYISHGSQDDRFPVARAREARDRLEKLGYNVTYREEPMLGHAFPPGECDRIWNWFNDLFSPPAAPKEPAKKAE